MALLAGIGAGGAVGGILGAILGATMPEYEAKRYKGRRRNGGILLSVHCDDSQWAHKAIEVLTDSGAEHIATTAERKADYAAGDRPAPRRLPVMATDGVARTDAKGGDNPQRHPADRGVLDRSALRAEANRTDVYEGHPAAPGIVRAKANSSDVRERHSADRDLAGHPLASLRRLTVRDVMTRDIELVEEDTTLAEAAHRMRRLNLGLLPVRSGDSIAGVVTDRDITIHASSLGLNPAEAKVGAVMTTNYFCCFDHQDLLEVARIMEERQVRRLPVLDKHMRLVGIVSLSDLAAKAGDERLAGEVLRLVATSKA